MFVTSFLGLLTFGLVFNHAAANLITKSSEDENSKWRKSARRRKFIFPKDFPLRENIFSLLEDEKKYSRRRKDSLDSANKRATRRENIIAVLYINSIIQKL